MEAPLLVERNDQIRILTLNRPQRLNALDHDLRQRVAAAIADANADDHTRAVVLTGAGWRAFSAGQDLTESAELGRADGPTWMASWARYFSALASSAKPLIVAVNGVAAGAGFETALLGDARIASRNARFLMAEADVGLPAIVGQYLLALHLGRSRTTELILTGRTITAEEARDLGLARDLVPDADLLEATIDLAREVAAKPAVALRLTLSRFHDALAAGLADAEAAASLYQSEAVASGAPQAAMQAFLAARAARRQASGQK